MILETLIEPLLFIRKFRWVQGFVVLTVLTIWVSATHPIEPHCRTLAALLLLAGRSPAASAPWRIAAHSGASNYGFPG